MRRIVAIAFLCGMCQMIVGCAASIQPLPGESDLSHEVSSPEFWGEVARVAQLSGTDEPAPAVRWLADKRTTITYVEHNFITFQVNRFKLVILNAARAEEYGNIVIPTSSRRPVSRLSARTIRKDGTVVPVAPDAIHERSRFPEYMLYTDLREKVFAMPAFEDSCIIEYEYVRTVSGADFEDGFVFSTLVPTKTARYSFGIAADLVNYGVNVAARSFGQIGLPLKTLRSAVGSDLSMMIWEKEDVSAIVVEPHMPPYREVSARVTVALDRTPSIGDYTWQVLGNDYYDSTISPLVSDSGLASVASVARNWIAGCIGDGEKIEAICNGVIESIRYVAVGLEGTGWVPQSPEETLSTKYGDCKDMSVLVVALLRSLDIEANPALLMTTNLGILDTTIVASSSINHMIVLAKEHGREHWLDPTAGAFAEGGLPWSDRGVPALVLGEDGCDFRNVPAASRGHNVVRTDIRAEVGSDGKLTGEITQEYAGDLAVSGKAFGRTSSQEEIKRFLEWRLDDFCSGGTVIDWEYDVDRTDGRCLFVMQFEAEGSVKRSGDRMIVDGTVFGTAGFGEVLPQRERQNPVELKQPVSMEQSVSVKLPTGWSVESLPGPVNEQCGFGSFRRSLSEDGGVLSSECSFELARTRMLSREYDGFREFVNGIERWNREPVILVRR